MCEELTQFNNECKHQTENRKIDKGSKYLLLQKRQAIGPEA